MQGTSFTQFMKTREQAADAYVRGDGKPVDAMVPHQGSSTFHSPRGDTVTGAEDVAARYLKDAQAFHKNGVSHFEVLQQAADDTLAFWTGFQVATVQIGDMPRPIDMRIRVTEIFHRIDGEWKLIHRHADMPSSG
ncbi:MAG TPA: nuclear transport factor 2 family protein [Pseudolabrys sp.]|nr:nuclear transport factor 2 family protein [Pseudolabrys sp.]